MLVALLSYSCNKSVDSLSCKLADMSFSFFLSRTYVDVLWRPLGKANLTCENHFSLLNYHLLLYKIFHKFSI